MLKVVPKSLFFACFVSLALPALSSAQSLNVVHYDPQTVELEGTLETQTFPGPPNYESIAKGDRIEKGWFLLLDRPVTALANHPETDLGWKTEHNVKIIHIAMTVNDERDWKKMSAGKRVKIRGTLFNRQNGHHHSRVLIKASEVVEVTK